MKTLTKRKTTQKEAEYKSPIPQGLEDAFIFESLGTSEGTLVVHRGPIGFSIENVKNTNNNIPDQIRDNEEYLLKLQDIRLSTIREHIKNLIISVLVSAVNLAETVTEDDLTIVNSLPVNVDKDKPLKDENSVISRNSLFYAQCKYSLENVRKIFSDNQKGFDIPYRLLSQVHDSFKIGNIDLVCEQANVLSLYIYNKLLFTVETEDDLLFVKAITNLFFSKFQESLVKYFMYAFNTMYPASLGEQCIDAENQLYGRNRHY